MKLLVLFTVIVSIVGCSYVPVWKREQLKRPDMNFNFLSGHYNFSDHVYSSKEASSGGITLSIAGCGCK